MNTRPHCRISPPIGIGGQPMPGGITTNSRSGFAASRPSAGFRIPSANCWISPGATMPEPIGSAAGPQTDDRGIARMGLVGVTCSMDTSSTWPPHRRQGARPGALYAHARHIFFRRRSPAEGEAHGLSRHRPSRRGRGSLRCRLSGRICPSTPGRQCRETARRRALNCRTRAAREAIERAEREEPLPVRIEARTDERCRSVDTGDFFDGHLGIGQHLPGSRRCA